MAGGGWVRARGAGAAGTSVPVSSGHQSSFATNLSSTTYGVDFT